jgi:sialidase-1
VLNMRGTNKQFFRTVAISRNAGHSWSDIELDKNLPEPACEASLLALSLMSPTTSPTSRSMWLFCNPPGPTRRNLTLKFSDDEGRSWPRSRVIDAGPAEYSSLTRLPHGTLGVLYELSRSGQPYRPELHFVEVPLN